MKNSLFVIAVLAMIGCSRSAMVQPTPTHNQQKQLNIIPPAPTSIEWHYNLDTAAITSAASHKPMLMFFHARYCGWCNRMKREVFTDPVIIKKIDASFIPMTIDMRDSLAKDLGIEAVPTIVIVSISEKGKVETLGHNVGFIERNELLEFFDQCLEKLPH